MSSRDNLLNDKKNCSFKEGDVENVYYTDTIGACGDGSLDVKGRSGIRLKVLDFRHFSTLGSFEQVETVIVLR